MSTGAFAGGAVGGALGLVGGLIGGYQAKRTATRFRRRQRRAINEARQFADQTAERIRSNELFQRATDFLGSTFDDAAGTPLVQDFGRQIQASQASRGLFFGGASAQAEAGGLAVAAQRLRQDLLPQLQSFALAPEQLRQQTLAQESGLRSAAATGAPLPGMQRADFGPNVFLSGLNQAISGAAGGAALGAEFFPGATPDPGDASTSLTPSSRMREADFAAALRAQTRLSYSG